MRCIFLFVRWYLLETLSSLQGRCTRILLLLGLSIVGLASSYAESWELNGVGVGISCRGRRTMRSRRIKSSRDEFLPRPLYKSRRFTLG